MPASISQWRPYSQKIDSSAFGGDGRFVSGAFTMIAAGPPRLASLGGAVATGAEISVGASDFAQPIGLVQGFSASHQRSFSRFWELGSERSYFISGRTVAQIQFGRVLYHGPSLLRMMYAFYSDILAPTVVPSFSNLGGIDSTRINPHNVKIPPGFGNVFLNLASDLFSQPCGLLVYMKDSNEDTVAACYAEESYVPSHGFSTDAQGLVIQEQLTLQPERVVPIAVASIGLVDQTLEDFLAPASA